MFSDSFGLGSASWALIPATDFPKFVFVSHTEKKCRGFAGFFCPFGKHNSA